MSSNRFSRTDRVAEMMQRKLAQIIRVEVKDPRLSPLITISAVQVSKDLSHAKVYFTAFNADPLLTTSILNGSASYLRTALARTLDTRIVPQLHFVYDESLEYGQHLSRLIDEVAPPESLETDFPDDDIDSKTKN